MGLSGSYEHKDTNRTFCMTIKSLFRFEIINKVDLDFSQRQILSSVCPPEVPLDICFYPINPKARAKMLGIVNKVYS